MYRFLLTPKWIAGFFGMLLAIAIMIGLGNWQLDRLHAKRAASAAVTESASAPVVAAYTLLPDSPKQRPKGTAEWHRVSMTGTYLADKTVLIRGSTSGDGVGFEIVVPLQASDGRVYLIDRGFVDAPAEADKLPPIPAAPEGEVQVTGRVRIPYAESSGATKIEPIEGVATVRALNTEVLAKDLSLDIAGGYIAAVEEKPADGASYPKISRVPLPDLGDGPHLSYAVQWFLFAAMAAVGFGYLVKREGDLRLLDDDGWDDDPEDGYGDDVEPDVAPAERQSLRLGR